MQTNQTEPREIDISGPKEPLMIEWEDGHKSSYELEYLRRRCPCAECTDHGATPMSVRLSRPIGTGSAEVHSIEEVGRYALQIKWRDGHDSGIYSFAYLREICACQICKPQESFEV